jgi:hypothetical protein
MLPQKQRRTGALMPDQTGKQQQTAGFRHQAQTSEAIVAPLHSGNKGRRQRRQCGEGRGGVRRSIHYRPALKILVSLWDENVSPGSVQQQPRTEASMLAWWNAFATAANIICGQSAVLFRPDKQDFLCRSTLGDENIAHPLVQTLDYLIRSWTCAVRAATKSAIWRSTKRNSGNRSIRVSSM